MAGQSRPRRGRGSVPPGGDGVYTVAGLSSRIRELLEGELDRVSVRGQVTNLGRPQSGHLYFSLVDEEGGGRGSRFSSPQVPVVVWRSTAARLRFRIENGQKVLVSGRIGVYEPRGTYQVIADRVAPEGTGELQLAFEQLKAKLQGEGLFAPERKRPLPYMPRRIGLVTSPTGAAIRDFLRMLYERHPRAWVRLAPAPVQGSGAGEGIARAIDALQRPEPQVEVVVLTRGGGSLEDLWAFNEESVARALARCTLPTVCAVGHEVDFTIADFVADWRAPTPTAAAECVAPDVQELERSLADRGRRLAAALRAVARAKELELGRALRSRVLREPQTIVERRFEGLDRAVEALENSLYNRLRQCDDALFTLTARLEGLSPLAVLARGYSVVTAEDGTVVRDAALLADGDPIQIRFSRGQARALIANAEATETTRRKS